MNAQQRHYVEVVTPEVEGRFHYHLPPELVEMRLESGVRLLVPFGRGWRMAFFVRAVDQPDVKATKAVLTVLEETSLVVRPLFELLLWISDYYFAPLGAVIKGSLPQGIHLSVRRRFSLTGSGEVDPAEKKKPVQKSVIDLLASEGPLTEAQLKKRLEGKGLIRILSILVKAGRVQAQWEIVPPAVKKIFRRILVLKKSVEETEAFAASLSKRSHRQAALLGILLSAGGSLPATALEAPLRAPLKRLIAKNWIDQLEEPTRRIPENKSGFRPKGTIRLNPDQKRVTEEVVAEIESKRFVPFLLHGVTGSGKTEVYLRVIEAGLRKGKGAILLVPEISLTAQLVARFHERFGDAVALFHSGLSAGERYDEWCRIKEGQARLVIGVRSAIFAPMKEVGVIIVDEEQDSSYKQDEGVRYHARDVALVRARSENAVVVLGSATPSFESYHHSQSGKYRYLHLPDRIEARSLPAVRLVDLRKKEEMVKPFLTRPLIAAIEKRLTEKEQVLLFVNRRGFSSSLLCGDCGALPSCLHCTVSLTYHKNRKRLVCHYCGFEAPPPTKCPKCRGSRMVYLGIGTEQVEETVRSFFPSASVARMDRDTTQKKGSHQKIIAAMVQGEVDILIGTQMVTKGHDFPGVTLVGVLCGDLSLQFPDFRSPERTFQLLAQVAGRAGRGERPGEVMIQTFQPDHASIVFATAHDYISFYQGEIQARKAGFYPPCCRLTRLLFRHRREEAVVWGAGSLTALIKEYLSGSGVEILGPAPTPMARIRGEYRYQILMKAKDQKRIAAALKPAIYRWKQKAQGGTRLEVDVDPQQFG